MKTINEGIGDDNQSTRYSTASPFSHKKYIDDITKLKHIGHVDSDKQKNSPISAGARGLARTHDFAFNKPTQMMRYNQNATEDIKNILKTIDTLNK